VISGLVLLELVKAAEQEHARQATAARLYAPARDELRSANGSNRLSKAWAAIIGMSQVRVHSRRSMASRDVATGAGESEKT
jgi:hypothetical protein